MSNSDKPAISKAHKNRRWKKLVSEVIDRASYDRVHGTITLTLYDGEIRQLEKHVKIQNPEKEITRLAVVGSDSRGTEKA